MRATSCIYFSIAFHFMTGDFCVSFLKTKDSRNPVFWVPGPTVISHNMETDRNEDIKKHPRS